MKVQRLLRNGKMIVFCPVCDRPSLDGIEKPSDEWIRARVHQIRKIPHDQTRLHAIEILNNLLRPFDLYVSQADCRYKPPESDFKYLDEEDF